MNTTHETENLPGARASVRLVRAAIALCLCLGSCLTACGSEPSAPAPEPPPEVVEPPPEVPPHEVTVEPAPTREPPILPEEGQLYPETQVRLVNGDPRDVDRLRDTELCASCHPDAAATWASSAHARASFDNPWYRQSVDAMREEVSPEASRFCAGCHDPVLLVADAMHEPVEPFDPRAHAGVTCMVCHGIQEVRLDGTASYTLSTAEVPIPDPADAAEVAAHVEALTPEPLRTSQMCGSCHRGFLGEHMGNAHHLAGIDDLTAWGRSGYSGSTATRLDEPVEESTCQGCHMPMGEGTRDFALDEQGQIHLHRFMGGHTALAGGAGDDAQLAAIRERLEDAVRVDVASARVRGRTHAPADGAPVRPGDVVAIDVVVRNTSTGHRFPGGTRDAQDTWLEVVVTDANGTPIAAAAARHETEDDPSAHRFHAVVVNEHAEPQETHRVHGFAAAIFDRTIAPRDAAVVRYGFEVPAGAAPPFSVEARVRHRRFPRALHAAACEASRSLRGRQFARASEALGRAPIDACAEQPVSEVAGARVWLGEGGGEASGGANAPRWRRHFDHGLGLIGDVQEHLDDARPALALALAHAPDEAARAMVLFQRARLEGRQGRLDAALADVDRAEALVGERAALHRVRGDAYAQVWRWEEAAEAYARAAEGAPRDDSRWTDLARARGSAGQDEGALDAAVRGLALAPRHEGLLRSQYLALSRLERAGVEPARVAYLGHRVPDALSALRLECARELPWCATERLPVHTHAMHR